MKCVQVKFIMGPGPLDRRCYYVLVTVLDIVFKRSAVWEHMGELRFEIFIKFLCL